MRALVVFFSRTGNTRMVAAELARELGAEAVLEEIVDLGRHSGFVGWFRAGWDALRERRTPIGPPREDPAGFDVLVVGTPVWAGRVSSPVRAYLALRGPSARRVAFFCTMDGSGGARAFAAMAALCGKEPAATAEFLSRSVREGTVGRSARDLVDSIRGDAGGDA